MRTWKSSDTRHLVILGNPIVPERFAVRSTMKRTSEPSKPKITTRFEPIGERDGKRLLGYSYAKNP